MSIIDCRTDCLRDAVEPPFTGGVGMQVGEVPQDVLGRLCSWERELGTLPTLFLCLHGISQVLRSSAQVKCNIPDTTTRFNIYLVFVAPSGAQERG